MKTNLMKKSIAAAILFGFILTTGGPVSSVAMAGDNSDRMLLAAGGALGLNGKAKGVPRAPAGTVKPPKKAAKPPKVVDNRASSEIMLAKNKQPVLLPGTTPPVDAPIKNAPHAPGAIHGKNGVPSEMMLAKAKKPAGTVDAPIKHAPHPLGTVNG